MSNDLRSGKDPWLAPKFILTGILSVLLGAVGGCTVGIFGRGDIYTWPIGYMLGGAVVGLVLGVSIRYLTTRQR